jgi:hypothetical protein
LQTAQALERTGEPARSESSLREAIEVAKRTSGSNTRRTANVTLSLIEFLRRQGKLEMARSEFAKLRTTVDSAMFNAEDALGKRLRTVADSVGVPR